MEKILSLAATLVAYTDTLLGLTLRSIMVTPITYFDADLASYIAFTLHF